MNAPLSDPFGLKSLLVIPVILLVLVLLPSHALCAQITIDSDEQFRFAEQTMEKGDFLRAVVELSASFNFSQKTRKSREQGCSLPSAT